MGGCCSSGAPAGTAPASAPEKANGNKAGSGNPLILMVMGKPGSGKGTQAPKLAEHLQIPHLSTGDLLRAAVSSGSDLGKQAKDKMDKGELVPDDLIVNLIQAKSEEKECSKGYILDGFPRTVQQAERYVAMLSKRQEHIFQCIIFDVPDEILTERICGRWIHKSSGRSYHTKFNPPKVAGKDDITGEDLVQRQDDNEDTLKTRLRAYEEETKPVITFLSEAFAKDKYAWERIVKIDANQDPEKVFESTKSALNAARNIQGGGKQKSEEGSGTKAVAAPTAKESKAQETKSQETKSKETTAKETKSEETKANAQTSEKSGEAAASTNRRATVVGACSVCNCQQFESVPFPKNQCKCGHLKKNHGDAGGRKTSSAETAMPHLLLQNSAFVFIKPHANNAKVEAFVKKTLQDKSLTIVSEGTITGEEIDKNKYIDSHYYAIASKATLLQPSEIAVPADKFKEFFGKDWQGCLDAGNVYNAMDACKKLQVDAAGLDALWRTAEKEKKVVKFGGGFYCGELKPGMYVFNAFFMMMRNKFVEKGCSIHYFEVEWDQKQLSWADFRGKLLGPTNPEKAPPDSIRGTLYKDWKELGLASQPNNSDNGVHASASPFEGLAEKCNWLSRDLGEDGFGKALLASGIDKKTLETWCKDPRVHLSANDEAEQGSLFDALEDTNASVCLNKAQTLFKAGQKFQK